MANFPTSLDALTNPAGTDALVTPDHAAQHATANDILEQLELKLGIDSSSPSAGLVLAGTGAGASQWGQVPAGAMTGLITTRGDLLTRDGSAVTRKGIGTADQILVSDGTDLVWRTAIAAANMPALTGDVTTSAGAVATTIAAAAVTLAKMANLAQDQFIGRITGSTGVPETATITAAARTMLDDTTVAAMLATLMAGADMSSWTPVLSYATPGTSSWTAGTAIAKYTKVGDLCFVTCYISRVPTNGTASGNLQLTGLPFAAVAGTAQFQPFTTILGGWTKAGYTQIAARVSQSSTVCTFLASGSGVATVNLAVGDIPSGGTVEVFVSGTYKTA